MKKLGEGNFLEKVSFPQTPILQKLSMGESNFKVQLPGRRVADIREACRLSFIISNCCLIWLSCLPGYSTATLKSKMF